MLIASNAAMISTIAPDNTRSKTIGPLKSALDEAPAADETKETAAMSCVDTLPEEFLAHLHMRAVGLGARSTRRQRC